MQTFLYLRQIGLDWLDLHEKMLYSAQFKFRSPPSESPMQGVQFERHFEGQEERG